MNASKISALASALIAANQAGHAAAAGKDDMLGSCNLDSVKIKIRGFNQADQDAVMAACGIRIDSYASSSWPFKGYRHIGFSFPGQAHMREVAVQAAYKSLQEAGYDVAHYQAMD